MTEHATAETLFDGRPVVDAVGSEISGKHLITTAEDHDERLTTAGVISAVKRGAPNLPRDRCLDLCLFQHSDKLLVDPRLSPASAAVSHIDNGKVAGGPKSTPHCIVQGAQT